MPTEQSLIFRLFKSKKSKCIISYILIFVFIPLTIYLSFKFADRKLYITSLLIIIFSMIPFFVTFEKSKPQARQLTIIAVMSAIAVASRAAFIWAPHFKPITAIVIISGIALGPLSGFLTGTVSGFVSDFIFGQGVWTPWQMFAFGLAGLLGGLLFNRGSFKKSRINMCIYGGAVVMLVVGPILDTCSLFTMVSKITWENALAVYISGLPINAVHATATVLTIFLAAVPILEKVERVRLKYGIPEE